MTALILVFTLFAVLTALSLALAARHWQGKTDPIVENINELLPQTQCAQCGFPGCRPYAEAIANGDTDINRCPPGGDAIIQRLSQLLGTEAKPLDQECGVHKPPMIAVIDENRCIGCTLCIQACPVDAIVGANQRMHTVITPECTGCELCLPPCPVDCIDLIKLHDVIPQAPDHVELQPAVKGL